MVSRTSSLALGLELGAPPPGPGAGSNPMSFRWCRGMIRIGMVERYKRAQKSGDISYIYLLIYI